MTGLDRSDVRSVIARSALLLALAAALLLVPEVTDPGVRSVLPWFAVLILLQLAPLMWARRPDLFAPPVLTGILSGIATAATVASMLMEGEVSLDLVYGIRPDEADALAERALLALLLGTLSYYVGYYTGIGVGIRKIFPKVRGLVWDRGRVFLVCAVATVIFVVTYGVFQARVGVPIFDVTQLGLGKRVWRDDPTLSWMMRGVEIGFVPVLLYLSAMLAKRRGGRSLILPGVLLVIAGLLVSRLGQRGTFVLVLLTALVLFHYHRVRVPATLFLALCFAGMVLSSIMLEWRLAPEDQVRSSAFMKEASDPAALLANHESERQRFSSLALIMKEFPENHSYLMGKSWASIVALPIPRWIWHEKVDYFEWQDDRIVYRLVGAPMPAPYVGALYANLSWIGIVVGMLLFGAFHRGLYEWLLDSNGDRNVVLLYAVVLVYFGPTMLNVSICMQYYVPLWLAMRFAGRRPREALA